MSFSATLARCCSLRSSSASLARYVSINSFIKLVALNRQKEVLYQWPPRPALSFWLSRRFVPRRSAVLLLSGCAPARATAAGASVGRGRQSRQRDRAIFGALVSLFRPPRSPHRAPVARYVVICARPSSSHRRVAWRPHLRNATSMRDTGTELHPRPAQMTVTFLGLTGPRGTLPYHYTELLLDRVLRHRDHTLRDFWTSSIIA